MCYNPARFWRIGRVVDGGWLEINWGASLRGFESSILRQFLKNTDKYLIEKSPPNKRVFLLSLFREWPNKDDKELYFSSWSIRTQVLDSADEWLTHYTTLMYYANALLYNYTCNTLCRWNAAILCRSHLQVKAILEELRQIMGNNFWLFHAPRNNGRRRCISMWLNDGSHTLYMPERIKLMQWWSDYLGSFTIFDVNISCLFYSIIHSYHISFCADFKPFSCLSSIVYDVSHLMVSDFPDFGYVFSERAAIDTAITQKCSRPAGILGWRWGRNRGSIMHLLEFDYS